jgi:putative ABC transport system permease protein
VEISGIIDDNMHTYMYTSIENASRLAGFDGVHYNAMVSGTSIPISADIVASTVVMSEHSALFEELMGPIDAVVYIIIVFGALLCIFIMYLVINMIVGESKTGISVMKVLGFSKKEIGSRVLDVNMILVIIGFLVGIPLTFKVAEVGFADTIEEFGIYFKAELNLRTAVGLLIGFVIIFIAYEISLLLQKRKIAKINMVEALKENRRNE